MKSQQDVGMMRNEFVRIKQSLKRESVDYRPEVTIISTLHTSLSVVAMHIHTSLEL